MLNRDKNLKLELIEREKAWMSNWQHCKHNLNMTFRQASNTNTMLTSIGKRQRELVEANANILDWSMKIVSTKKKVPLPENKISDCIPYTIIPPGIADDDIPIFFSNPNIPSSTKDASYQSSKAHLTLKAKTMHALKPQHIPTDEEGMDPVEEVALYEKKQKELAEKELARQRELQNPESSKETPPKDKMCTRKK